MEEPVNPGYTPYHPKWYRRRIPIFWWLGKLSYTKFIGRELTSVFVLYAAIVLLLQSWALARGEGAYQRFASWLGAPAVVAFHVIVLLAITFHPISWLNLTPKALVIRLGGRRVPAAIVILAHYGAWLAASGLVAWLLLRG